MTDRYDSAPTRAAHLAHHAGNTYVDVTRTGRVPCEQLLTFARKAVAGAPDRIPAQGTGESFQDGVIRLSIENQALQEQLATARRELAHYRLIPGPFGPQPTGLTLTDLERALLERLKGAA